MFEHEDTYRHKGLRKKLVDGIREKGITDESVLSAMEVLPRHFFLDPAFFETAYEDKPFQIGSGQTISQPYTVAYQSQLLKVSKRDKVLEIGTGSGYQAAVLGLMGARVFTIERHKVLHEKAKKLLSELNITGVRFFYGDGFEGVKAYAPYDRILITAAAPEIPETLLSQLKVGGILVAPVGKGNTQKMVRLTRTTKNEFKTEYFENFRFVPMLKGKVD